MEENGKRKRQTLEDLIRVMQEERERVENLPLKELEEYIQELEFTAKFFWPGEKHEHPQWLLQLLEKKRAEARGVLPDTEESSKRREEGGESED